MSPQSQCVESLYLCWKMVEPSGSGVQWEIPIRSLRAFLEADIETLVPLSCILVDMK